MPNYRGGDITELVCKHPLGTFRFEAKANESFTIDHGGFRANDDANGITGAGTAIHNINRTRWSLEGPVAADFTSENESKNWELLAAHAEDGVWTISHVSGWTKKAKGRPVGDQTFDTNTAQGTLKVAGSGKLENVN